VLPWHTVDHRDGVGNRLDQFELCSTRRTTRASVNCISSIAASQHQQHGG
jgi:hypothetical protein